MLAIGKLTFRSVLTSAFFPVLGFVFAVAIASAPRLTLFALGEEERIARDAGASLLRLAALVLALALGIARAPGRDAEALVLARAVTPTASLAGRYLGSLAAALLMLPMLSAVLYGTLTWSGMERSGIAAEGLRASLEAAVYLAAATALGAALPKSVAALALIAAFAVAQGAEGPGFLLPAAGPPLAAVLAATGYLALGAAVAEAREPGA